MTTTARQPAVIDKRGILTRPPGPGTVVEVGCGDRRRYPGSITIDRIDGAAVDLVGEALEVLAQLPAEMADLVTSSHFLEHVAEPRTMVVAMARVLRPGGRIEIVVPHFSNPYFRSDPTHVNALGFGLYTMSYLAQDDLLRRRVPAYVRIADLRLERVDLRFKSTPPFYGRHAVKRACGLLFNSCRYLQELWEENLCWLLPCYELRYLLRRD